MNKLFSFRKKKWAEVIPPVYRPHWQVHGIEVDPMTDVKKVKVGIKGIEPLKKMSSPYNNVTLGMEFIFSRETGLKPVATSAIFVFNKSTNFATGYTKYSDKFPVLQARIRWDYDKAKEIDFVLKDSLDILAFPDPSEAALRLENSKRLLLEVVWHGQGAVVFEIPTAEGSRRGFWEARSHFV